MPFGQTLATVRERDVKLDDQVAVARLVEGAARALAARDEAEERQGGELPFRVALLDACPDRRALRGVLAEGKRVKEAEPSGIGDPLQRRRGTLVLFVAGAFEQCGVAREEVQVPVFSRHIAPVQTRPTTSSP